MKIIDELKSMGRWIKYCTDWVWMSYFDKLFIKEPVLYEISPEEPWNSSGEFIIPSGENHNGYVHNGRYHYGNGESVPIEYVTSGKIRIKEEDDVQEV